MKRFCSEFGGVRGPLLLVLAAIAVSLYAAGRMWLSRYANPAAISERLESVIGSPVRVKGVETRLLRREIVLTGFEMEASTAVESAALELNPSALLSGDWEFEDVDLYRPAWRVPGHGEERDAFMRGLLLPVSVAMRAKSVTIREGVLLGPGGGDSLVTGINGRLARQSLDSPYAPVEAALRCSLRDDEELSVEGIYIISETGDSISVGNLRLAAHDLSLEGSARGSMGSPAWARAELASGDFHGGSLKVSAGYEEETRRAAYSVRVQLAGADGKTLLRDRSGVRLVSSGCVDADFTIDGDVTDLSRADGVLSGAKGDVRIVDAEIDPGGPLAELASILEQGGGSHLKSVSGHLDISHEEIVVRNMIAVSAGMKWTGSGKVRRDGSLSGSLLGRIPAEAIGRKGTALSLVAAMLAGQDGRIPAAFSVGGTIENPDVRLDVDGTADALEASGRPQAKQLLKGLSRSEKDDIAKEVNDFLRGGGGE